MGLQTKLLLAVVVCLSALFALRLGNRQAPTTLERDRQAESAVSSTELVLAAPGSERKAVQAKESEVEAPRVPSFDDIPEHAGLASNLVNVRGRVIDIDDHEMAGIEVCRYRPPGTLVGDLQRQSIPAVEQACLTADATGRFEIQGRRPFHLKVRDENYATVCEGVVGQEDADEVLVVAARRIPLAGILVDEGSLPIAHGRISFHPNFARPGLDLSTAQAVVLDTITDAQGRFDLEDAMDCGGQMHCQASGYVTRDIPVPAGGDSALVITMSHDLDNPYTISGRVVLEDGSPAAGAYVSTGSMASTVDEQGFFLINFERWFETVGEEDAPITLTAVLPALLPSSLALPSVSEARRSGWPETIEIKLQGKPLTIQGVLVDQDGHPISGALLEPADMSNFGYVPTRGGSGLPRTQEQLAGKARAYSGKDGTFELGGLFDRPYTIRALIEPSLLSVTTDPVDAGTRGLRMVLDQSLLGTIEGRIVDQHGQGIPQVRVAASHKRVDQLMIGTKALTDDLGYFRIQDVTTTPEFLRLEGDAIVPELFRQLEPNDNPSNLVLGVGRRCRVQFDWGAWPGQSDRLAVVDAFDQDLTMMQVGAASIAERSSIPFQATVTNVIVVPDTATHAVIYREDREVTRISLDLNANELNLVQL